MEILRPNSLFGYTIHAKRFALHTLQRSVNLIYSATLRSMYSMLYINKPSVLCSKGKCKLLTFTYILCRERLVCSLQLTSPLLPLLGVPGNYISCLTLTAHRYSNKLRFNIFSILLQSLRTSKRFIKLNFHDNSAADYFSNHFQ